MTATDTRRGPGAPRGPRITDEDGLTRTQRRVLFVGDFIAEHGYSPSTVEIGEACGMSSRSSVAWQVSRLIAAGHLTRVPGANRTLRIAHSP